MIYLDNSSTTLYKPRAVTDAFSDAISFSANAGRSSHALALKAATEIYRTRKRVAETFDCDIDDVIFGFNCTDMLNLAISSLGGHIVTTALEHNSVLRPLSELTRSRAVFDVVMPRYDGLIHAEDVEAKINRNTTAVIINHVSNVTGAVAPIREIGEIAAKRGIFYIVDGAQSVGYINISIKENHIDALCFSPHKGLHGFQGLGVMCKSKRFSPRPTRFGGTGTDSSRLIQPDTSPECYESGTMPVANITSLASAIQENKSRDFAAVKALGENLRRKLEEINGVTVYTPDFSIGNIVTFNVKNLPSTEVGRILDERYGIAVRAGLHCAPLAHRFLGTIESGAVRASLSYDNDENEIAELIRAVKEICENAWA